MKGHLMIDLANLPEEGRAFSGELPPEIFDLPVGDARAVGPLEYDVWAQRFGSDLASQEYGNAYNRFQTNRSAQSQEYQNAFNRYQAERAAREQGYGNAFNRFQTERINTLAPLQSLAGVGQSATQQAQQAAQNFATGATSTYGALGAGQTGALGAFGAAQGSNIIGAGNARASGYVGGANALSGGVGQALNFYQNQNLVNQLANNSLRSQYGAGNVYTPGGGGLNTLNYNTTGVEF